MGVAFAKLLFNGKCRVERCGSILEVQLTETLIVLTGAGLLSPFFNVARKHCKQTGDMKKLQAVGPANEHYVISNLEMQTELLEYTGNDLATSYTLVSNSLASVVLFGMLVPALIPVLSYFTISLAEPVDAFRLVKRQRRPFPL